MMDRNISTTVAGGHREPRYSAIVPVKWGFGGFYPKWPNLPKDPQTEPQTLLKADNATLVVHAEASVMQTCHWQKTSPAPDFIGPMA
jgi:hypothetical protein